MRYRAFKRKKDNLFYFQFLSESTDVLLNSQSYNDKDACFNGIRSVLNNAGNANRYEKSIDGDGNHFFILKAGNEQEIGRSIKYDSEQELDSAIDQFTSDGPAASSRPADDQQATPENTSPSESEPYQTDSRGGDDYKPLDFYEVRISGVENGFDQFDADDGEFYFTYNLASKVVLISEGYKNSKSRDNGIASVTKNMTDGSRYLNQIHPNGKYYFNLRAGNNQEIATSRWFDSEENMNHAIAVLQAGGAPDAKLLVAAGLMSASATNEKIYKDYKPLAFYEENIAGTEFGYDAFENENAWYFSVNHDGTPVLISEDYKSEAGRDKGIQSVKKNVKNEKRYERMVHPNGMHYFNLLAGNKQEIATSRWFESKKEMEKAISWLTNTGGTRRRKKAARAKNKERTYLKKDQAYLCNNITYDTFQSGGNERYYFVFKDKDGKAVLINGNVRGFASPEDLEAGIKQVLEYSSKKDQYEIKHTKNGRPYFYIQNKEGKNIARSSLFYNSEEDMKKAMDLIQCVGATMAAAAAAPKPEAVVDDYLPCERYKSDGPGFHTFYDEDRKEYYFSYNDADGNVLLRSEGYTTEAARDNGIASVEKNAPIEERWVKDTALNGKYHYYALKAGNHQEIARSCYHSDEAAMLAAFALTGKMFAPEPEIMAASPVSPEAIVDDYLSCDSYAGESGFHTFTNEENGEHYFSYNRASDGKTLLRSEGYTQKAARDNGIESVKTNAAIEERWGTDSALHDRYHFFFLKAGNHQEIARSCYYDDKAAMLADFNWIKGSDSPIGVGSAIIGGAMMSAGMLKLAEEEKTTETRKAEQEKAAAAAAAAKAKAEEEARLAAEAARKKEKEEALRKKAEEEKAAAAALAAAAAAEAAAKAKAEEEARLAAEAARKKEEEEALRKKAEEEKAAAAALAAAAAAEAAAKAKAEEEARLAAEAARKKEEEEKAAALALGAAAAAAMKKEPITTPIAATAYADGGDQKSGGLGWLWWLLAAILLALLLLWFLKGCDGCNNGGIIGGDDIENTENGLGTNKDGTGDGTGTGIGDGDGSGTDEGDGSGDETPTSYGRNGTEMGYKSGTMEFLMANHLAAVDSNFPSGRFDADAITYSRNSDRLNSAAKKQLDNVIALLKEYPEAKIEIYGYLLGNETGSGNKEVSLDDERAKSIYNYLIQGGIEANRMNFQGDGAGDRRSAAIRLKSR